MQLLVNLRYERVVEPCRAEAVCRVVKHLLVENLASNLSCRFTNSVPIYHVRHVALIAWDHCGLSASRYLFSVKGGQLTFSLMSLLEVR